MDLERLRYLYHVIPAKGISNLDAYEGKVRLLDNELAPAIQALYDDKAEAIVAYLLARGSFTEKAAREWVRQVEASGVNLSVRGRPISNRAAARPTAWALSAEDAALLTQARALRARGIDLAAIATQQASLTQKARRLEIASIVAALEGRSRWQDVTGVAGYRHYPAVIDAVEAALRGLPKGFASDVGEEGRSPIDAIVLSIVNALPTAARLRIGAALACPDRAGSVTSPARTHRTEPLPADVAARVSDEQIDALIEHIGL